MSAIDSILEAADAFGVLGRDVPVRLVNVSASGCLLEATSALEVGTMGTLWVTLDGVTSCDEVRIIRCAPLAGRTATHALGARFLWASRPEAISLRRVLRQLLTAASPHDARIRLVVGRSRPAEGRWRDPLKD